MNEKLLHFIWQHQYYDARGLTTVGGESVQVLQAGQFNAHQGPDFLNARLKINNVTWAGHVEMHVKTSDWIRHGHQKDRNYDNVILHVVWQHDMADDELPDKMQHVPVVSLESRVSSLLLKRYEHLMKSRSFIPCGKMIADVKPLTWRSWKDRLLAERLQKKSERILALLKENGMHWEETFWQLIARNFGIRQNADAFEELARRLPLKIIARHKSNYFQIEAMLMGQAGLLNEELDDEYYIMLQKEYHFLRKKYQLQPIRQSVHFLRMRPSAFPTLRLAQLSALLHRSSRLFSKIQETSELKTIRSLFSVT
ncbi:MAG: DUF2851 family protein, partial [Chitinophagaceae bacterium]|nr:DUF2851 family protein [Chitinophagaceae bacterium]